MDTLQQWSQTKLFYQRATGLREGRSTLTTTVLPRKTCIYRQQKLKVKAGLHVKTVSTSLNKAFLAISRHVSSDAKSLYLFY